MFLACGLGIATKQRSNLAARVSSRCRQSCGLDKTTSLDQTNAFGFPNRSIAVSRTEQKRHQANVFRALAFSALLSGFVFCGYGQAADLDNAEVKSLDGLETRFFEHTYQKDDTEARLDRLEKLVYGEARSGDQAQRLVNLVAALPKQTDFPADPAAGAKNSPDSNQSAGSNDDSQSSSNNDPQTADNAAGDAEDYPTVDAIEQTILGKSFQGQPIAKRLDQLELKAFNKTSQDPDLSERVNKLSEYVQKHMHKNVDQLVDPRTALNYQSNGNAEDAENGVPAYSGSPGGSYGGGNYGGTGGYSGGGGSGSYGMNPPQQSSYGYGGQATGQPSITAPAADQVAWLETKVFGRAENPKVPLIDRLHRLEKSVFPTETMDANTPISAQIKLLVNAVELMHNSNPEQSAPAAQSQYGYQQQASNQGQYPYQQNVTQNAVGTSGSNFPSWPPQGAGAANQYSQYSANAAQPGAYPYQNAPGTDGSTTQYEQQLNQMQQPAQQQQEQQQQQQQHQGHPLLKGLAHALMSVGTMAASSGMMMNMGGMGGYGGYGGYGNYGSGMMPGYGGMGGYGNGFGGIHF